MFWRGAQGHTPLQEFRRSESAATATSCQAASFSLDKNKTIGYYSNAKLGKSSGPCEVRSCREAVPLRSLPVLPSQQRSPRTRRHSEPSEESRPGSQVATTPSLARSALECGSLRPLFRLELARGAVVRPSLRRGSAHRGGENARPTGVAKRLPAFRAGPYRAKTEGTNRECI